VEHILAVMKRWGYLFAYATIDEAERLQAISLMAFKANFGKYGHYPPGIESADWHQEQIRQGLYHKVIHEDSLVGGIYLTLHPNQEMKIEYLYISPYYQNKKIGLTVMELIEDQYKEMVPPHAIQRFWESLFL
jgi:hypothetical protein